MNQIVSHNAQHSGFHLLQGYPLRRISKLDYNDILTVFPSGRNRRRSWTAFHRTQLMSRVPRLTSCVGFFVVLSYYLPRQIIDCVVRIRT